MLKIDIIFSFPFPKAMLRGMTDSALRTPFHHLPSFLSHWTPLFQTFITLCPGLWVELCPPKLYAQVLTLHTCERTSFGNTVIYAQVLTLHTPPGSPPPAQWLSRHGLWPAHRPFVSHTELEQSSVEWKPDSLSGLVSWDKVHTGSHPGFSEDKHSSMPWKHAS